MVNGEKITGTTFTVLGESVVTAEFRAEGITVPVSGLKAEQVFSGTVVLSWDAHECPLVTGYTIMRNRQVIAGTTDCTFTDRNLDPDTTPL